MRPRHRDWFPVYRQEKPILGGWSIQLRRDGWKELRRLVADPDGVQIHHQANEPISIFRGYIEQDRGVEHHERGITRSRGCKRMEIADEITPDHQGRSLPGQADRGA